MNRSLFASVCKPAHGVSRLNCRDRILSGFCQIVAAAARGTTLGHRVVRGRCVGVGIRIVDGIIILRVCKAAAAVFVD